MDDERQQDMGLVLDYSAVGLMSNNNIHVAYKLHQDDYSIL